MARIRDIKPDFFLNEDLAYLPHATRLLFIGLWTIADREGRLEDRPVRIHAALFPYDDDMQIDGMLGELSEMGFIIRYQIDRRRFLQIVNFGKHQRPHPKEVASTIPPPMRDAPEPPARPQPGKGAAEPNLGTAEPAPRNPRGAQHPSGSSGSSASSGSSGSLACGGPARETRAPTRSTPGASPGEEAQMWLREFGAFWCERRNTLSYGKGAGDARGVATLTDLLGGLLDEERAEAYADRRAVFARWWDAADRNTRSQGYPFAFFVERFNHVRAPPEVDDGMSDRERRSAQVLGDFAKGNS